MKFVVILDPKTLKTTSFQYDEPGQVPPIVPPPDPDEPKDAEPPEPAPEKKPS